jgi:acetyl-CoA C-acetyltransferase
MGLENVADNTPILVGAGQVVEREATHNSPMNLAARAAADAVANCGGSNIAGAIDTIAVVRLFSDSAPMWACPFGRSNNPPQSIAAHIGANPTERIYSQTGGNQPQHLLIEAAKAISSGEKSMVLLAGSEGIRNQRTAQRNQETPNWTEDFSEALDDRGQGAMLATRQEIKNGMIMPVFYYMLIEQARRTRLGLDVEQYRSTCGELLESFSQIAADNPYSQFPGPMSAADILSAEAMTHLYTKRMIAQDGINQAAAVILCSAGKARELGIPEENWVFLHGMAEGNEVDLTERADPSTSVMAGLVAKRALDIAGITADDIDIIDIYSCFPCAVTAISDQLGLPADGSVPLTMTGGLPYFGGPGNNYSMHALVETVWRLRADEDAWALVTANGGMLSKHAAGVFSRTPSAINWADTDTYIDNAVLERKSISADPRAGTVISYTVNYHQGMPAQAIVLCETDSGERFVSCTAPQDQATVKALLDTDPTGKRVRVTPPQDHTLHFTLEEAAR